MTDDLVKRLRMAGDWARKDYPQFKSQHVTEEAADRIEALEKMLDATGSINSKLTEIASSRLDRIEALEAALREIADQCVQDIPHPVRTYLALDLARAALGEKKDDSRS